MNNLKKQIYSTGEMICNKVEAIEELIVDHCDRVSREVAQQIEDLHEFALLIFGENVQTSVTDLVEDHDGWALVSEDGAYQVVVHAEDEIGQEICLFLQRAIETGVLRLDPDKGSS